MYKDKTSLILFYESFLNKLLSNKGIVREGYFEGYTTCLKNVLEDLKNLE